MTEEEKWRVIRSASTLLGWLQQTRPKPSTRKVRLYICACSRWVPDFETKPRLAEAVRTTEALADGHISMDEMNVFRGRLYAEIPRPGSTGRSLVGSVVVGNARVWDAAKEVAGHVVNLRLVSLLGGSYLPELTEEWRKQWAIEYPRLCEFVREVFGNPFRHVELDPAWLTSTVTALAAGMYESRDFSAMPILADALQDAGCENADVLGHCRDPNATHVRGCWVVDLVLGKE